MKHFEALGADANARDISRVLRVVRTTNQKTGRPVRVIWVNTDYDILDPKQYRFGELVEQVLPPLPEPAVKGAVKPLKRPAGKAGFSLNSLNWTRLCDLQKLIELRGGDMGEGLREPMAFWLCNFFALRYSRELALRPLDEWNEFRQLCLQAAPHWNGQRIKDKTSHLYQLTRATAAGKTIEFCGKQYPPLYTPKSQYLIDAFRIEPAEERELATLHSTTERKRRQAERDKARKGWGQSQSEYQASRKDSKQEKAQEAQKLKAQGLSIRAIATEMGLSKSQTDRLLKVSPDSPL